MFCKIALAVFVCICFPANISGNFAPKWENYSSTCEVFLKYKQNNAYSPVDVDTKRAKYVFTPSPLLLQNALFTLFKVINTGHALEVHGNPTVPNTGVSYGGTLCGEFYIFHKVQFIQNLHLGSSFHKIDGKGYPLTARVLYYNPKYGTFEEALKFGSGVVAIDFHLDFSPKDNPLFYPAQWAISWLYKAGSFTRVPGFLIYGWYDALPFLHKYYTFWGSYRDLETGKQHPGVINVMAERAILALSKHQFLNSFALLENSYGEKLDNSQSVHGLEGRTVFEASKIAQLLTPF